MPNAIVEPPAIQHAGERLHAESAIALSVAELLTDWPHRWLAMQDKLVAGYFKDRYGPGYLVSRQEVVDSLPDLRSSDRHESKDVLRLVGKQVAAHLARRKVRIGLMSLYSTAPMTLANEKFGQQALRYLRSSGGPNLREAQRRSLLRLLERVSLMNMPQV